MAMQILFIDDEPEFVRPHITALETAGFDVTHVGSYAEAFAILEKQTFHLIVLDLILPSARHSETAGAIEPDEAVGLELHKVIRSDPRLCRTPIVFLTVVQDAGAHFKIEEVESRVNARSRILVKPKLPSRLVEAVKQLLHSTRGQV